jgi:hypothetical protein
MRSMLLYNTCFILYLALCAHVRPRDITVPQNPDEYCWYRLYPSPLLSDFDANLTYAPEFRTNTADRLAKNQSDLMSLIGMIAQLQSDQIQAGVRMLLVRSDQEPQTD